MTPATRHELWDLTRDLRTGQTGGRRTDLLVPGPRSGLPDRMKRRAINPAVVPVRDPFFSENG